MQKILYLTTQSEFGGAQRYIFDLATNLKNEFNVIVATGNEKTENQIKNKLAEKNIKYYEIKHLKRSISPISDLLALFEIKKLIRDVKPDIIHLNSSKISILGSLAYFCVKKNNSKLIYTAHGWVFNEPMPVWKKIFYRYAEKLTSSLKDKIICVSEFDRQTALKEKIAPEEKLITIHNGITPINFLSKEEAIKKIIGNWKLEIGNYFLVGSIGNLYKTKGFEYLIEAIKKLSVFDLQILTFIIGEGGEKKNLETLIQKDNLKKNIILTGEIKNAAELLLAFDIYVCSSVKEGLPYSILEAMSAGLPIVSTRVGGIPEMIEDKKNGLLVEPQNADDLAKKIKMMIENKTKQQQYGASAKEKVAREFSLEKMIDATKNIYLN